MHFCRNLHFVAIYALFLQIFLAKIAFSVTSHVFCMYGDRLKNCIILLKQSLQETKGMEAKQVDGIRWRLDLLSACDASQWFAEVGEVKGCSWDNRTIVL